MGSLQVYIEYLTFLCDIYLYVQIKLQAVHNFQVKLQINPNYSTQNSLLFMSHVLFYFSDTNYKLLTVKI